MVAECLASQPAHVCDHVVPIILDVTKEDQVAAAVAVVGAWVKEQQLPLVGLVNNAGISTRGPVEMLALEKYRSGTIYHTCMCHCE